MQKKTKKINKNKGVSEWSKWATKNEMAKSKNKKREKKKCDLPIKESYFFCLFTIYHIYHIIFTSFCSCAHFIRLFHFLLFYFFFPSNSTNLTNAYNNLNLMAIIMLTDTIFKGRRRRDKKNVNSVYICAYV